MDYLDGALPGTQRAIFAAHLGECPDCVAYLESYKQTVKLGKSTRDAGSDRAPEDLIRAILAARKNN
jgi:anti-sigma factor RsiW